MEQPESGGRMLLIDKPLHWTSFDIVKFVRGIIREKKVGHAGTLDPLATGLLIVCSGKLTKSISAIQDADKEYTGTVTLGIETPSYDLETEIRERWDVSHITLQQVEDAVKQLTGTIEQVPPMHSAIRHQGQRAYKMARRGEEAELKSRQVRVTEFEITRFELPAVDFRIECSKGTYIRSLARDLGKLLGIGACLTALRRTRIGQYSVEDAITTEELKSRFQQQV
jgi:tRNA pseudouridine55 synthase